MKKESERHVAYYGGVCSSLNSAADAFWNRSLSVVFSADHSSYNAFRSNAGETPRSNTSAQLQVIWLK